MTFEALATAVTDKNKLNELKRLMKVRITADGKVNGTYSTEDRYTDFDNYHNHFRKAKPTGYHFHIQLDDAPDGDTWMGGIIAKFGGKWFIDDYKVTVE